MTSFHPPIKNFSMLKQPETTLSTRNLSISLSHGENTAEPIEITQQVADGESLNIVNQHCKGHLTIRIKGFSNDQASHDYFRGKQRLYSIQWQGEIIGENNTWTGDDLVLAADFQRPPSLPIGFRLIEEFSKLIDPGLDLSGIRSHQNPAVCSPLLCAANWMSIIPPNTLNINACDSNEPKNTSDLIQRMRRKIYTSFGERRLFRYKSDGTIYSFDWYSPYVDWTTFDLQMGLRINGLRYLNGQPVKLSLRTRDKMAILFSIQFQLQS